MAQRRRYRSPVAVQGGRTYRVSGTTNLDSEKLWRILVLTLGSVLINSDRIKNQDSWNSFQANLDSQAWTLIQDVHEPRFARNLSGNLGAWFLLPGAHVAKQGPEVGDFM